MVVKTTLQRFRFASKIVTTSIFLFFLAVVAVSAEAGGSLFDDFDTLISLPNPAANFWVINCGDDGCLPRFEADAAKVENLHVPTNLSFARLSVLPDTTEVTYNNAEIAELQTGVNPAALGRWLPTPSHPVVIETRVRWSDDYNQLGLGAIGTSGVWLWNSPINTGGDDAPINSLGFSWSQVGSPLVGLHAEVLRNNLIVFTAQVPPINMQDWNTFKIVWEAANPVGLTQRVSFYVNGELFGATTPFPALPALSLEIWNDNQLFTFAGALFLNPESPQEFDLDYISISQP